MNLIKNILLIFYLVFHLYFLSTIFYADWQRYFFKEITDLNNPVILASIVKYLYNLFYIFLVTPWLIDYKFNVPDKQFVISSLLFLLGIIILIWAFFYSFKGADGAFMLN